MKKIIYTAFAVFLLSVGVTSCSKDEATPTPAPVVVNDKIVGTWKLMVYTIQEGVSGATTNRMTNCNILDTNVYTSTVAGGTSGTVVTTNYLLGAGANCIPTTRTNQWQNAGAFYNVTFSSGGTGQQIITFSNNNTIMDVQINDGPFILKLKYLKQ